MFKYSSLIIMTLLINNSVMANSELNALATNSHYWTLANGGYENQRYSELSQINSENAHKLKLYKKVRTGIEGVHAGQPLVIPGKMTGHDFDLLVINTPFPNKVMALNLDTYDIVWEYTPEQDSELLQYTGTFDLSLGVAYVDKKIVLQQRDTRLTVLNAFDGKVIWSIQNGNPMLGESNVNSPIVIKEMIITGNDGSEFGIRGHLSAYHIDTGQLLWRAYSTGPDDEMLIGRSIWRYSNNTGKKIEYDSGSISWKSKEEYMRGGGTTEGWYAYDSNLELIYYGTGNPGTHNPFHRIGDNKWTNSIIARDVNTGEVRWVYQMTPHDSWAYEGTNEMTMLDMEINGISKKLLVHFDQNGFVYKLDRENGELISAVKYHEDTNWADKIHPESGRPILNHKYNPRHNGEDVVTKDICPAPTWAGSNKGMSAFNSKSKLLFTAINNVCMTYEPVSYAAGGNRFTQGQAFVNSYITLYPAAAVYNKPYTYVSKFIAWDPVSNKVKWEIPDKNIISGGIFSTKGNLAFYGTTNGVLNVIDTETSKLLWAYDTHGSISGGISTWIHNDIQYIGLMTGDVDNMSQGVAVEKQGYLYIFTLDN